MSSLKTTPIAKAKTELLAPAGSLEAFFAAADAGADAIYVGLQEFSARAKANNFSLSRLKDLSHYLHQDGRRLYLALNTLLKEEDLPRLVEVLAGVEEAGVDALILQDLAVWRLAREYFPAIELHASTQMTIHNRAGVEMLAQMGFSRVVLARELSLEEISAIHSETDLELEHFVHGAHCYSFSGQCFFSSFMGGQSGNRGRCTQPCRRRYQAGRQQGYFFSPNDLSAIELVPELSAAGICSFKIEGRMKSAEYVSRVVEAYRLVIDCPSDRQQDAVSEAKLRLRDSFGRQPTRGFLPGGTPENLLAPATQGATGRFVGKVSRLQGPRFLFQPNEDLMAGDRLRIQPASDRPGVAVTVREFLRGRQPVKQVRAGEQVGVALPAEKRVSVGDTIYKVASGGRSNPSQNQLEKRLQQLPPEKIPVSLKFSMNGPGELRVQGAARGVELETSYEVPSYPAEKQPLSGEILAAAFAKTGTTPFALRQWQAEELPPVVIPPSRLKQVRRAFYDELETVLPAADSGEDRSERRARARAAVAVPAAGASARAPEFYLVGDLRALPLLKRGGISRLVVPLSRDNLRQAGRSKSAGLRQQLIWDLPWVLFDPDWPALQAEVEAARAEGFRQFRLHHLALLRLFPHPEEVELFGGYRLFCLNSQAATAWKSLGLRQGSCYLEDDRDNIQQLLETSPLPLNATIYSEVPLLLSRMPLAGLSSGARLQSDRGEKMRVVRNRGVSTLFSERPFSLSGQLGALSAAAAWTVDLGGVDPQGRQGRAILEAIGSNRPLPDTSLFNFDFGLA